MYLTSKSKPLTTDVLESLIMYVHRLIYHLHKTYEKDIHNTMKNKTQWRILGQGKYSKRRCEQM